MVHCFCFETIKTLVFLLLKNSEIFFKVICEPLLNLYLQIKKALRGVKVEVTHRGNMRRKYRISGLTSQATGELT